MKRHTKYGKQFSKQRNSGALFIICGIAVFAVSFSMVTFSQTPRTWKSIVQDKIHDNSLQAVAQLQNPSDALFELPSDYTGNQVAWVEALAEGYIEPRVGITPDAKHEVLEMDIVMGKTGEMPLVLFPHRLHTEWLSCENCHDTIFQKKVGATPVSMFGILAGEFCGRCHGAVAFPLTECNRCHSVPRDRFKGKTGVQPIIKHVGPVKGLKHE